MGLRATIDLTYNVEIDIKSFIDTLINIGWSTNDNGKITYLINEEYDWWREELEKQELLFGKLSKRFTNNEIVGIALIESNLIGGLFHFLPGKREVMILLTINRVRLENMEFTDYSFYLNKLYPVIKECTSINFCDAR